MSTEIDPIGVDPAVMENTIAEITRTMWMLPDAMSSQTSHVFRTFNPTLGEFVYMPRFYTEELLGKELNESNYIAYGEANDTSKIKLISFVLLSFDTILQLGRMGTILGKRIIILPNGWAEHLRIYNDTEVHCSVAASVVFKRDDFVIFGGVTSDTALPTSYAIEIAGVQRVFDTAWYSHASGNITASVWNYLGSNSQEIENLGYVTSYGVCTNMSLACQNLDMFDSKDLITYFARKICECLSRIPPQMDKKVEITMPTKDEVIQELTGKYTRLFTDYYRTYHGRMKNQITSDIRRDTSEKLEHLSALVRLEKSISEKNTLLRSLSRRTNSETIEEETLRKTISGFFTNDKFRSFSSNPGYMEAETGEITIYYNGKEYHIGRFNLQVYDDGKVFINNLTNRQLECYDHPHVRDGQPCLGNIKNILPEMVYKGDTLGVFNLLHQYLCSYNEDGPYLKVQKWGSEDEWCNDCDNPTDECECNNCSNCGNNMDRCDCSRCPRTGELMEDTDCNECSHWSEEDGCNY